MGNDIPLFGNAVIHLTIALGTGFCILKFHNIINAITNLSFF